MKKKNLILGIITAVCFLWMPVNGVRAAITSKMFESGDIVAIVFALLPVLAGVVLIIGALFGARIVAGIGAVLFLIPQAYSIYVYIMQLQQDLPDEAKKSFRSLILSSAIMILAFLFLALACFDDKRDLAFCIIGVLLFVAWFFVRNSQLAAEAPKLPLILTAVGSILGTILLGVSMAVQGKKKKEAALTHTDATV